VNPEPPNLCTGIGKAIKNFKDSTADVHKEVEDLKDSKNTT